MTKHFPRVLAVAALLAASQLAAPSAADAQAPHPLVGTWKIEYERGRRIENGEATPIMGTGRLTIEQRGDSLLAAFEGDPRPDGTVPPRTTAGARASSPEVVFTQEQTATITINGEQQERKITLTWSLNAIGDTLGGTLRRDLPMMPEPLPPTPVKGTRVRG
jgi:hypothetical protein